MKPSYCAKCGQPVITRVVDDRPRTVCPSCDTIHYENPLPVAASVVLNDKREVLLVKRDRMPQRGEWCLPMGFAELGETIEAAARRELEEEAGIEAQPVQLLDADSYHNNHYGDLLIVTFEMQKTGGVEVPGDDASEVGYFPINNDLCLAFPSNAKALRACSAVHRQEWAIQDSFIGLQAGGDTALLSDELVALIQERAEEVVGLWLVDVRTNPTTSSYLELDPDELIDRVTLALSQFGRWLKGDEPAYEVRAFYRVLAKERAAQGLQMHELLSSLALLKKHLWNFACSQSVWQQPVDAYRVMELSRRVAAFFDKASYHAVREFEGEVK